MARFESQLQAVHRDIEVEQHNRAQLESELTRELNSQIEQLTSVVETEIENRVQTNEAAKYKIETDALSAERAVKEEAGKREEYI
jgi:hypothetical protein